MSLEWGANLKSSHSRAYFKFLLSQCIGWDLWWERTALWTWGAWLSLPSPHYWHLTAYSLVSPKTWSLTSLCRSLRGNVLGHYTISVSILLPSGKLSFFVFALACRYLKNARRFKHVFKKHSGSCATFIPIWFQDVDHLQQESILMAASCAAASAHWC